MGTTMTALPATLKRGGRVDFGRDLALPPVSRVMVVFLDDIRIEDAPPPAPPASGKNLPKFTREQIETWRTDHDIQAFSGILKDAGLPPDITMDDIKWMRLKERHGL
jgi:hypothetical protein